MLADVLDRAQSAAALSGNMKIRRNHTRESIVVTTDHDRLAQVFINLMRNADKYCDAASPELRIEVRDHGGSLTIDFVDNGSGISPADSKVIFEKFSRLSDGARAGGTGLGLAICREIMANLNGEIGYLPGQGGGAFRVILPRDLAMAAQ